MGSNLGRSGLLGRRVGREAANGRDGWAGQLLCQERGGEKPWLLLYKVHRNGEERAWPQGAPDTAAQGPRAGGLRQAGICTFSCPHLPVCPAGCPALFFEKLEDVCLEGGLFIFFFKEEKQEWLYFFARQRGNTVG